eukprot:2885601-Prorocentrum_lima.AAC.1
MTALEGSIPNDKELKRMERCITEISKEIKVMKRDLKEQDQQLEDLSDQMNQLEKNVIHSLNTQADKPPAPATPRVQ